MKRRARTKHQERNVEHREYLAWIHTQPCAACGTRQNIQAAHVGRGGMGMKHGSDAQVIPLCGPHWDDNHCLIGFKAGCHAAHDQFLVRDAMEQRGWDAHQVAVHRGRFEARATGTFGDVPF